MSELKQRQRRRQEQYDYLMVLGWLETASAEQISGVLSVSTGVIKSDLETGIQALIETERPDLVKQFPHLQPGRCRLNEVATQNPALAAGMKALLDSMTHSISNSTSILENYGRVLAALRELHAQGVITAHEREMLMLELESVIDPPQSAGRA